MRRLLIDPPTPGIPLAESANSRYTLMSLALLLCSAPAQADIYRSVDRDGRIVFTDVRPTAGRWERLYLTKSAPFRAQPAPDARRFAANNGSPRFVVTNGSDSPHESPGYQRVAAPARKNGPPKAVVMYLSNAPS